MDVKSVLLGGCIAAGACCSASAGPWPREAGSFFASLSAEHDVSGNTYAGFYGEYGLTRRRTVGVEVSRTDVGETSGLLWYQKSLDNGDGPNRLSYSMGIGAILRYGEVLPHSQVALMWGRGFSGFMEGGWLTAEGRIKVVGRNSRQPAGDQLSPVEYSYTTPEFLTKLDLTAGLRATSDLSFVSQLRLEVPQDSDFLAKLAGSVIYAAGGPAKLELGFIAPLAGPSEPAVKLGAWLEF